ncbi:uncharacterized protein LOC118155372 isoform X2 [Callithrix jacchus]
MGQDRKTQCPPVESAHPAGPGRGLLEKGCQETFRVEPDAVAAIRDHLRPSSRFSLLLALALLLPLPWAPRDRPDAMEVCAAPPSKWDKKRE